jgi:putative hydrolase of the HAD superfamily
MIAEPMNAPTTLPWNDIDTVLLDLDGTLLDLAFDNHFWRVRVPEAWARERGLSLAEAQAQLVPRFRAREGTLDWYCIDYWTRELQLDIAALKRIDAHRIAWLPQAQAFLLAVRAMRRRLVLLTNAHPTTLAIKDQSTQVVSYFDAGFSSHVFGTPKEDSRFWRELAKVEALDPARSLFVDDSLPVLRAARAAGIGLVYAVRRPDSSAGPREHVEFPAVDSVAELLPPTAAS